MPQAGFEPTIPVYERAKTVHVLDRADAVTGTYTTNQAICFFFFGATAPIWALAYLHETLRFTSVF
jgi:hypothetical protein